MLTLKSLELLPPVPGEVAASAGLGIDLTRLAGLGLLAAVALAIGLFVLRPALRQARRAETGPAPLALPGGAGFGDAAPALTGEIAEGFPLSNLPLIGGDPPGRGLGQEDADPVSRLRRLIGERQTESLEILKNWMDSDGGRA